MSPPLDPDPARILRLAVDDPDELEQLRMQATIHFHLYHKTRLGDVHDLVQAVVLTVLQSAGNYDPTLSRPGAWLNGIMRNKIKEYERTRTRGPIVNSELVEAHDGADTLLQSEAAEHGQILEKSLSQLSVDEQHLIRSVYLQGRDQREFAAELGITYGTLRKRLSRAREHLKAIALQTGGVG